MNILVTGAAGYIGSVVTEVLCDHGHEVTAWDSLINGHRDAIDGRARFECVDLLDAAKVPCRSEGIVSGCRCAPGCGSPG